MAVEPEGGAWSWWAAASSAQLAVGIVCCRRGYRGRGNPALMPFKAFIVASLFVGAGASAALGALHASGIRKVEDMKEAGASFRRWLGGPERVTTRAQGE